MGKYNNLARSVEGFGNRVMFAKWEKLLKAGIVRKPNWWDAVQLVPPPHETFRQGKLKKIVFPEDALMKQYQKLNPDWHEEVLDRSPSGREKNVKTRAHVFVTKWQEYIEAGMSKEEAYSKVNEEFKQAEGDDKRKDYERQAEAIVNGTHPAIKYWKEEEDKYVQEAYDHAREEWEAARRKKQVEKDQALALQAQKQQDEANILLEKESAKKSKAAAKKKKKEE